MLGANSMALVVTSTDKSLRARALGMFAAAQAVGISAGPVIGGLLLGTLGWPWVFWINVPFGLLAVVAGWLVLPITAQQNRDQTFDWRGALLLAPALAFAVLALNQVSAWGPTSPALLGSVGAAIVLVFVFLRQERAAHSPLIDLALLEEPAFLAGALACALSYAMLYGMFFLASFALVRGYEESAIVAGLKLAIIPISLGIVAPFAGGLADRMGTRLLSVAGMAICFVALLALTVMVTEPVANLWIGALGLAAFGAGLGLFIAPNNHATINAAPAEPFRHRRRDTQSDAHSRHGRWRRQRFRGAVLAAPGRAGLDRTQAGDFLAPSFRRGRGGGTDHACGLRGDHRRPFDDPQIFDLRNFA